MSDYISRQAAIEALAKTMPTPATPDGAGEFDHEIHIADEAFADAIRIIESLEPADVVPVVRCKECKHCYFADNRVPDEQGWVCEINSSEPVNLNGFCSYGERKE